MAGAAADEISFARWITAAKTRIHWSPTGAFMSLDLDLELRVAVFDHVRRLAGRRRGLVTALSLNEGLTFMASGCRSGISRRASSGRQILRDPGAALTIQTSFEGPYDDRQESAEDQLIYRYRGTDPNHPDNVAVRRAMELRRPLLPWSR